MPTHLEYWKLSKLDGDDFLIIGGYESGIDAAYHLANNGNNARVFDMNCPWEESSDPSVALSTYSFERICSEKFREDNVELYSETAVKSVTSMMECTA